jgi:hypothetical protein
MSTHSFTDSLGFWINCSALVARRNSLRMGAICVSEQKALAVWVDPRVQNDGVFDADHPENRDDENYAARLLRQALVERGWLVHTQDVLQRQGITPNAVLFFDIPRRPVASLLGSWAGKTRNVSFAIESPLVKPFVWDAVRHAQFDAVFTWNTDLVGKDKRYVGICLGFKIDPQITLKRDLALKERLCVLIAGNKKARVHSPNDLYTKRLGIIRWYERHHPGDFDLYGTGWGDATVRFSWRLQRMGLMGLVNKIVGVEKRPSWLGPIKKKIPVLERYRFNIAFENIRDVPGYITEKIFDSFLGSCVPVYWGAPDITDFVPKDCFIDFRDYGDFEALHDRLVSMTDAEYLGYIERIEDFLRGARADRFRAEHLAMILARHIAGQASC